MDITITLTSYNLPCDSTEEEFDRWASFVAEEIDGYFPGHDISVDQYRFGESVSRDHIAIPKELDWDERDALLTNIREALEALWEQWCAGQWSYEGYWTAVFGERDPEGVVREFDLTDAEGLSEWVATAEQAAATAGGFRKCPEEWEEYHERALRALEEVLSRPKTYTYTFFDADPTTSGSCAWPHFEDIEIEAEDDQEALEEVQSVLESEARGLCPADGYDTGDTVYGLVWDEDGTVVDKISYTLTEEDLA